jgi:hypothetical protein
MESRLSSITRSDMQWVLNNSDQPNRLDAAKRIDLN